MYLSLIGLFNILFGWPIIFILYFTGIETLNVWSNIETSTTSANQTFSYTNLQLLFDTDLKYQILTNLIISTLLGFGKFGFFS